MLLCLNETKHKVVDSSQDTMPLTPFLSQPSPCSRTFLLTSPRWSSLAWGPAPQSPGLVPWCLVPEAHVRAGLTDDDVAASWLPKHFVHLPHLVWEEHPEMWVFGGRQHLPPHPMEADKDSMLCPRAAEGGQEIWAGRIKHPQDFTGPGNDARCSNRR